MGNTTTSAPIQPAAATDGTAAAQAQSPGANFLVTLAVSPADSVKLVHAINAPYTLYAGLLGEGTKVAGNLAIDDRGYLGSSQVIILWDIDPNANERYELALGSDAQQLTSPALVGRALHDNLDVSQVVIGPDIELDLACDLAESSRLERPHVGVILLRHRLDVTAMGQALRSGIREVVPADDQTALADAVRRSRELTSRMIGQGSGGHSAQEGKVVTVFSAKGGVGKTTLSTNLSTHLAKEGHKTVLIDLDLSFGDVAISLQLLPNSSVIDAVAMSGHLDEQGLRSR